MQLPKQKQSFVHKEVQTLLKSESTFITDLLSIMPIPKARAESDDEQNEEVLLEDDNNDDTEIHKKKLSKIKKTRARSLVELQSRLKQISSKKRLSYKERLLKKTIKTKINKKGKQQQDQRNIKRKKEQIKNEFKVEKTEAVGNSTNSVKIDTPDPMNGKMVFSKFDFSGIGKNKAKKVKKDPQKLLEDLKKTKEEVKMLERTGEISKAVEINEKASWKNAFSKAEGIKVKDDEQLLAKTIKRKELKKKQSKRKWEAREANVEKMKDERQKKRQDNIHQRSKAKKVKKMKQAVKRGKIIPGF